MFYSNNRIRGVLTVSNLLTDSLTDSRHRMLGSRAAHYNPRLMPFLPPTQLKALAHVRVASGLVGIGNVLSGQFTLPEQQASSSSPPSSGAAPAPSSVGATDGDVVIAAYFVRNLCSEPRQGQFSLPTHPCFRFCTLLSLSFDFDRAEAVRVKKVCPIRHMRQVKGLTFISRGHHSARLGSLADFSPPTRRSGQREEVVGLVRCLVDNVGES